MTKRELIQLRLRSQRLAQRSSASPEDVVRHLGAIQAQDYPAALLAIGVRSVGTTQRDVLAAIERRRIVRTWPMRGTLHFVASEDVRWMLKLLTPRIIAGSATRCRQLELDAKVFQKCERIIIDALQGGQRLSRPQLFEVLEGEGESTKAQRGYHILWRLAQEGLICFGPHIGKQPALVLLDDWVPLTKIWEREDALSELAFRFFGGHGPATTEDFAWWSGLRITEAREATEYVRSKLASVSIGDREFLWIEAPVTSMTGAELLLPAFDEYLLGYTDRSAVLSKDFAERVVPGNNGQFAPIILEKGQVVGTWRRKDVRSGLEVTFEPFETLKRPTRDALSKRLVMLEDFYEKPVRLSG